MSAISKPGAPLVRGSTFVAHSVRRKYHIVRSHGPWTRSILIQAIVLAVISGLSISATEWPPPFKISALITRNVFRPNATEPVAVQQFNLTVYSSNSWWRNQSEPRPFSE
jgi:hypothetical protein